MSARTKPQAVPLSAVATIDNRKSVGLKPYVGLEDISNDTGEFLGSHEPRAVKSATFAFDGRHVLYGRLRAYLNKALTPDFEGHCSTEIFPILPSDKLDRCYLFYWLTWQPTCERISATGTGARMPRANMHEVMGFEIPLPPLEEQKRIVAVLDQAFAALDRARALAEANLADADELFDNFGEALFSEVAASAPEKRALGDLTSPGSGITYGVVKPGGEGSVAFVRGGDLVNGAVRMEQLRTISKEFSEQYRRTLLRGGELLICLVGTPGQCAIAPADLAGANIARQVGMIRLRENLCAEYVRDYLLSKVGQQALGLKTGGSVQQVINLGDLKLIEVPLPDRARQAEIVAQIRAWKDATVSLRQHYRNGLKNLASLRQSLLQKAFAGKLT